MAYPFFRRLAYLFLKGGSALLRLGGRGLLAAGRRRQASVRPENRRAPAQTTPKTILPPIPFSALNHARVISTGMNDPFRFSLRGRGWPIRRRISTLSLPKGLPFLSSVLATRLCPLVAPESCRPGHDTERLPAGFRRYPSAERDGQADPLQSMRDTGHASRFTGHWSPGAGHWFCYPMERPAFLRHRSRRAANSHRKVPLP